MGGKLFEIEVARREGLFIAVLVVTMLVGISARTEFLTLRILRQHQVLHGAAATNGALLGTVAGSQMEVLLLWLMAAIGLYTSTRVCLATSRMTFRTSMSVTGLSHAPVCLWAAMTSTATGTFVLSLSSAAIAMRSSPLAFENVVIRAMGPGRITKVCAYICAAGAAALFVRRHEEVSYPVAGGVVALAVAFCLVISSFM